MYVIYFAIVSLTILHIYYFSPMNLQTFRIHNMQVAQSVKNWAKKEGIFKEKLSVTSAPSAVSV